jgi:scaffold Nfu/NifU family protein
VTEYIQIEPESTNDPGEMRLVTNLTLSEAREVYRTPADGEEGSALAQALFLVPGLAELTIEGPVLTIRAEPDTEWHDLIEDISAALKDFFL